MCWEDVFRTMLGIKREFELDAWDVGAMRFQVRQVIQMANHEIMIDVEHHKHELQQIEVPKSDKSQTLKGCNQQKK